MWIDFQNHIQYLSISHDATLIYGQIWTMPKLINGTSLAIKRVNKTFSLANVHSALTFYWPLCPIHLDFSATEIVQMQMKHHMRIYDLKWNWTCSDGFFDVSIVKWLLWWAYEAFINENYLINSLLWCCEVFYVDWGIYVIFYYLLSFSSVILLPLS